MALLKADGASAKRQRLDTGLLLRAYSAGLFPMADARDADDIFWVEPRKRGVLPLDGFHLPRSLARTLHRERFLHSTDLAFDAVVQACATAAPGREESWINATIHDAYLRLHREGHAHSVETWDQEGRLVGGLYGVRIGAAFFGESMFSRATDASKSALAHLVARLRLGGFRLLDTQFLTAHLARFGGQEIRRADYGVRLAAAVSEAASWRALEGFAGLSSQPSGVGAGAGAVAGGVSPDFGSADFRAPEVRLPVELLGGLGPSGKCIVQLLSQTS
jgi:leucyl/phenylalanyl-tRNA--protein transferase